MTEVAPRIGQLVRLLSSDKDGEIVAAAHALGRTLRQSGFDWHDLADVAERHLVRPHAHPGHRPWQLLAEECLRHGGDGLRPGDRQFLVSMTTWRGPPSAKQQDWLDRIARQLGLAEAAA